VPSIYDIPNWVYSATQTYEKNSIVYYHIGTAAEKEDPYHPNGKYYYASEYLDKHNNWNPVESQGRAYWYGRTIMNNLNMPHFFWSPSYSATVSMQPANKSIVFGDGYEQSSSESLSDPLLMLNLKFENRDDYEAAAINHFLDNAGGIQKFVFRAPRPFSSRKVFVCRDWSSSYTYKNNHSISATFEEVI